MRLVADVACHSRVVIFGRNLRESDRFCGNCFVTFDAEYFGVQFGRDDCSRIIGVLLQRPVTCFAGNALVTSGGFQRDYFWMACFTEFTTCKRHRSRSNDAKRISSEVPVLAETLRHKKRARNQKDDYSTYKNDREPDQMFRVL
jgi:hypothetical protein